MFIYKYMGGILDSPIMAAVSSMFLYDTDDGYDPHEHRNVPKPTTYMETFVHMIKGSVGAGILAMPFAVAKVGFIMGLVGVILIAAFATFCIHLLIKAQYTLCVRHRVAYLTYPQSMKLGVREGPPCLRWSAKYFSAFVDTVLVIWQLGICTVYVVFIAENIKQVFDHYNMVYSLRYHMCILLIPLIIVDLPKNLKLLAPVSTIANGLTIIGLLLVLIYLMNVDKGLIKNNLKMIGDWKNIPVFTGVTLFALEAVGVILALEYHMERPKRFLGKLGLFNVCMLIILVLYSVVGVFGFIKYGDKVQGSITLNLPKEDIKAQTTKILLAIALLLSFPLQNFVAYEILWHHIVDSLNESRRGCYDYCMRVFLVLLPFGVAMAVPQLGPFLSFFGALCLSNLGVIFPGVLDLCVRYGHYGSGNFHCIKDCIIIALGWFALVSGCYTSILEIAEAM